MTQSLIIFKRSKNVNAIANKNNNVDVANIEDLKRQLAQSAIETVQDNLLADNSKTMYEIASRQYLEFCQSLGANDLSNETALLFVAWLDKNGNRLNTLKAKIAGLRTIYSHNKPNPFDNVAITQLLTSIRNRKLKESNNGGDSVAKPKKALEISKLDQVLSVIDTKTLSGKRDYALIALGFSLATRQSELINIQVQDIEDVGTGLNFTIHQVKTKDKITKFIEAGTKAEQGLVSWLNASNITQGYVFRAIGKGDNIKQTKVSDRFVFDRIKQYCELAGLNPQDFASHSLRRGFVTTAIQNDVAPMDLMKHTGHKKLNTLQAYYDESGKESQKVAKQLNAILK